MPFNVALTVVAARSVVPKQFRQLDARLAKPDRVAADQRVSGVAKNQSQIIVEYSKSSTNLVQSGSKSRVDEHVHAISFPPDQKMRLSYRDTGLNFTIASRSGAARCCREATSQCWLPGQKTMGKHSLIGDDVMSNPEAIAADTEPRFTAHALYVGDRINTMGFESEALSAVPLAIRVNRTGIAVLFRYGVAVLIGVSPPDEIAFLERLKPRIGGIFARFEEETAIVTIGGEEDQVPAGGPIQLRNMLPERLLVIADVLAKSVVLAHDERQVARVFEIIEPFARELADHGRTRRDRRAVLQLIGNALLVQHRVSGRVAIGEKPDALWERPDLERLYARLEDEYELKERVDTLSRKLAVVSETADTLADIIDTRRSLRLELIVVVLIAVEIIGTFYQIYAARGH
jgi:uncharacterized Rmd1/YagE family protein